MRIRRCLDLFCCEGGASAGYAAAGFRVYGIDRFTANSRSRYPFPAFVGDVVAALTILIAGGTLAFTHPDGTVEHLGLADFDVIVGSPPCQPFSRATAGNLAARAKYDRLIDVTRTLLLATGKPYVIENVEDARPELRDPVLLCGRMFGLTAPDADGVTLVLERHRLFESNVPLAVPAHPPHVEAPGTFTAGVYGGARRAPTRLRITSPDGLMAGLVDKLPAKWSRKGTPVGWTVEKVMPTPAEDRFAARISRGGGYVPRSLDVQRALLRVDWMTARGMAECIPPIYAQHVGDQLLAHLDRKAA